MTLIAGYFSKKLKTAEEVLRKLEAFQILPGDDPKEYEHKVLRYAFGHIVAKEKPGSCLTITVEDDGRGNAFGLLGYVLENTSSPTFLTSGLATAGCSLERLEGQFVAVLADAASGQLHVVNDRFSSRPLYLLNDDGVLYFSSNLAFLFRWSGTRYRPDIDGWLESATIGHTLGSRTTAAGVTRLLPATHLTISDSAVDERQYWCLRHQTDSGLDPVRHSEDVFHAFTKSATRRTALSPKGVLALSGGLDSRLLAGAIPRQANYGAFTYIQGAAGNTPDSRAASEVAAALKLRHHIETLSPEFADPTQVIHLTGGMRPYQHMAVVIAYIQEVKRQGAAILLGGGPGDSLAGAFVPTAAYADPSRIRECLKDALARRLGVSRAWHFAFRDNVIGSGRQALRKALEESFTRVSGDTAAHKMTAWAMVYRQPAFTFTSILHTHPDVAEAACHLGYDYTDLMLKLPAAWLYQKRFYAFMIYSQLPMLRHIPYANTGQLLSGVPPPREISRESFARRIGRRLYHTARRSASDASWRFRPVRGLPPSLFFRATSLLSDVQEIIHSVSALRDFLDVQRCDELIRRTRRGQCPSEEVLGTLTSIAYSAKVLPN